MVGAILSTILADLGLVDEMFAIETEFADEHTSIAGVFLLYYGRLASDDSIIPGVSC